jgi:hypothetical protein
MCPVQRPGFNARGKPWQARAQHVATLIGNVEILVTGGRIGFQDLCCSPMPHIRSLANAELYQ